MSSDDLKTYYREAGSWSADRNRGLVRSRQVAWIVAGAATGVAVLEAIALMALAPMKTVVPYTLLVDRQTGNVQTLKPLDRQSVTPDEALVRSMLAQYVVARESFDIGSLKAEYRKVALWSAGEARERYVASMQADNPASPLASLPRQAQVETDIRSISPLDADTVMVRFTTTRTDPGGRRIEGVNRVAIIRYRFSTAAMSEADRLLNPLGFQVLRYRRDTEMAQPAAPVPAASGNGAAVQPPAGPQAQ